MITYLNSPWNGGVRPLPAPNKSDLSGCQVNEPYPLIIIKICYNGQKKRIKIKLSKRFSNGTVLQTTKGSLGNCPILSRLCRGIRSNIWNPWISGTSCAWSTFFAVAFLGLLWHMLYRQNSHVFSLCWHLAKCVSCGDSLCSLIKRLLPKELQTDDHCMYWCTVSTSLQRSIFHHLSSRASPSGLEWRKYAFHHLVQRLSNL